MQIAASKAKTETSRSGSKEAKTTRQTTTLRRHVLTIIGDVGETL